jgi:hypothetical protein
VLLNLRNTWLSGMSPVAAALASACKGDGEAEPVVVAGVVAAVVVAGGVAVAAVVVGVAGVDALFELPQAAAIKASDTATARSARVLMRRILPAVP